MRTTISSLLALFLCLPAAAHAGGYLSAGVGSDASLGGQLSTRFSADDLTLGRLGAGYRVGSLALEGVLLGTGLRDTQTMTSEDADPLSAVSLGADIKYYFGVSGALEGYVRGGLHKTWLRAAEGSGAEGLDSLQYAGRGYDVGGGLQYSFRLVPTISAALWLDLHRQYMDLESQSGSAKLTGTADMLTIGVSLGL